MIKKYISKLLPPLIPAILTVIVIEVLVKQGLVAEYILPAPSDVFKSLQLDFQEYYEATKQTLSAAFMGLLLAGLVGVALAVIFSLSKMIERSLYPYAIFFQTVPIVSIAPLLVIWFGFGLRTVVISAFIVSIFPIIANTLAGLRATDPALIDLFKLYGASRKDILFKLKLPFAVPYLITGLKISTGLAMIGAVIGEFIAGGGLGGVIDASRTQQRLDKVFAAIILTSFTGILLIFLLNFISNKFLKRWRELQ